MRRTGHLFEQVAEFTHLCAAARRAARGKALSSSAARFLMDLEPECLRLERELLAGEFQPSPYRTFQVTDPKPRTISAAAFRDRVVHHALCAAMNDTFERTAIADSYACRVGKGLHAALNRAQALSRRHARYLKLDVEHFFETADHSVLEKALARKFKDKRLLELASRFIRAGAPGSPPGKGLPIGNLTSQHFANFYLAPLDRFITQTLQAPGYLRYMDDLLVFADDALDLDRFRFEIAKFANESLALTLKDSATRTGPVRIGLPFLGLRLWPRLRRLDSARVRRFRRRARALLRDAALGSEALAIRMASLIAFTEAADATALRRSFFYGPLAPDFGES